MYRAVFEKTGNAVWISHLDLMRVLQRAFRRGGLLLKHSQGYNPHPCLSLSSALSVGIASRFELMDFELAEEAALPAEAIVEILNRTLPDGVSVLSCYTDGRKLKEAKWLSSELTLEYDGGVPKNTEEVLREFFARPELVIVKHSKKGETLTDIRPAIKSIGISCPDTLAVLVSAVVSAQDPVLNPMLLCSAVEQLLPDYAPDFAKCLRTGLFDENMKLFR